MTKNTERLFKQWAKWRINRPYSTTSIGEALQRTTSGKPRFDWQLPICEKFYETRAPLAQRILSLQYLSHFHYTERPVAVALSRQAYRKILVNQHDELRSYIGNVRQEIVRLGIFQKYFPNARIQDEQI